MYDPRTWMDDALCRDKECDPAWWDTDDYRYAELAAKICRKCPVQFECLDEALRDKEMHGIWGGLLPHQRLELIGRRASR